MLSNGCHDCCPHHVACMSPHFSPPTMHCPPHISSWIRGDFRHSPNIKCCASHLQTASAGAGGRGFCGSQPPDAVRCEQQAVLECRPPQGHGQRPGRRADDHADAEHGGGGWADAGQDARGPADPHGAAAGGKRWVDAAIRSYFCGRLWVRVAGFQWYLRMTQLGPGGSCYLSYLSEGQTHRHNIAEPRRHY